MENHPNCQMKPWECKVEISPKWLNSSEYRNPQKNQSDRKASSKTKFQILRSNDSMWGVNKHSRKISIQRAQATAMWKCQKTTYY